MKNKSIKIILIISKSFALTLTAFFCIFFVGEFDINEIQSLLAVEIVLLAFVPILYIIGSIIVLFKDLLGSIIMIFSILGFNVISYIIEGKFDSFNFIIFLIPALIIFILSLISQIKETKKT